MWLQGLLRRSVLKPRVFCWVSAAIKELDEADKVREAGWRDIILLDEKDERLTVAVSEARDARKELSPYHKRIIPQHPPGARGFREDSGRRYEAHYRACSGLSGFPEEESCLVAPPQGVRIHHNYKTTKIKFARNIIEGYL